MAQFESSIKQIPYPQQNVYNMLSDLSNIERVKDKIPEEYIMRFALPEVSAIQMEKAVEIYKLREKKHRLM